MTNIKNLVSAVALAVVGFAANATVVDFNGYSNTTWGDENSGNGLALATNNGYAFVSSGDYFHFINMANYGGPSNGTSSLLEDRGSSITMSKVGGGSFNLLSFLDYGSSGTQLSITGSFMGGGSVNSIVGLSNAAFTSEAFSTFNNLSSITFQGIGRNGGFGLENVTVSEGSTVPEPTSIALFGLALAAMAIVRKKRA